MRKIAVALSKGGVGKTTTAVHLAHGLAIAGHKTLLIDTDTQGQTSTLFGVRPSVGLSDVLNNAISLEDAVMEARQNLWLLAGGSKLAGISRMLSQEQFGGEQMLSKAMRPLEEKYDYIILDTSPGWDPLVINVLFYVDEIISPVALEVLALQGLLEFAKRVEQIQSFRVSISLPPLNFRYILPTFFDRRTAISQEVLDKLHEIYQDRVLFPIRYSVRLVELAGFGQTVFEYAPKTSGAEDYLQLSKRILEDGA